MLHNSINVLIACQSFLALLLAHLINQNINTHIIRNIHFSYVSAVLSIFEMEYIWKKEQKIENTEYKKLKQLIVVLLLLFLLY